MAASRCELKAIAPSGANLQLGYRTPFVQDVGHTALAFRGLRHILRHSPFAIRHSRNKMKIEKEITRSSRPQPDFSSVSNENSRSQGSAAPDLESTRMLGIRGISIYKVVGMVPIHFGMHQYT